MRSKQYGIKIIYEVMPALTSFFTMKICKSDNQKCILQAGCNCEYKTINLKRIVIFQLLTA